MSTENPQDPQTEPNAGAQPRAAGGDIVRELGLLGAKIGEAIRTALDSPQRYEIENEVREGFQTAVADLNETIGKARSTDVAKDMGEQADKMVGAVRASKVTQDLRDGLVKGLRSLNTELDSVLVRMEQQSAADKAAAENAAESSTETAS